MSDNDGPATPDPVPADPQDGGPARRRPLGRWWWIGGIVVAIILVIVLVPLASPDPDGLVRVAADAGFLDQATNDFAGILGGYAIPGVSDPWLSKVLAGLLGLAVVLAVVFLLGRIVARRKPRA